MQHPPWSWIPSKPVQGERGLVNAHLATTGRKRIDVEDSDLQAGQAAIVEKA